MFGIFGDGKVTPGRWEFTKKEKYDKETYSHESPT